MRIARLAGCALLLMLPVWATHADESALITTSATATETIRPTLASFDVTIGSTARTMDAARTTNATTTAAVKAALLAAGLPAADLKSSQLNVGTHWTYKDGDAKAAGFEANNQLHVETHALDYVGLFVDAALSAGAREVSAASFRSEETDAARHRALAKAVAIATADAHAIAAAAQGRLGPVVALSTAPLQSNEVQEMLVTATRQMGAPPPIPTSVIIPDVTISATVNGRWRLIDASH
jgi:uncharacterized protein